MERRLAAILAADMVGYSKLIAANEAGTKERQKAHRNALIDPKIGQYGGRIVKTTGDGMRVEFQSVVDAVQCAIEIQHEMPGREAQVPDHQRIRYRIGINLGDIVIDGDDKLNRCFLFAPPSSPPIHADGRLIDESEDAERCVSITPGSYAGHSWNPPRPERRRIFKKMARLTTIRRPP